MLESMFSSPSDTHHQTMNPNDRQFNIEFKNFPSIDQQALIYAHVLSHVHSPSSLSTHVPTPTYILNWLEQNGGL